MGDSKQKSILRECADMYKNELFDIDVFWEQYGDLPYTELLHHRTRLGFWLDDYQRAAKEVPSDEKLFAEFQDKKIEHALIGKLSHQRMIEAVRNCPHCGRLCDIDQKVCHQCGHQL